MSINYKKILKERIPFESRKIPTADLRFSTKNPRIANEQSKLSDISNLQSQIEKILIKREDVSVLAQDIEHQGSVIESLIVRDGTLEVLEGNRRLAACRMLLGKYGKETAIHQELLNLNCEVIPENTKDEIIFAFQLQWHVRGKKSWDAYEKANIFYTQVQDFSKEMDHSESVKRVAYIARESIQEVTTLCNIISLMNKYQEEITSRYSYYDVVQRTRAIQDAMGTSENKEKKSISSIKSFDGAAPDFRKMLSAVCCDKKSSKKFFDEDEDCSLEDAYAIVEGRGSNDEIFKKIKQFRLWLFSNKDLIEEIDKTLPAFDRIKVETKRVMNLCDKLHKNLTKK